MNPSQIIACLNALDVGELETLSVKLAEARQACLDLGRDDLAENLDEAGAALRESDIRLYRKRVHHVLARLGHLR